MGIRDILGIASGLVLLYTFYPYLSAIIRGETKPRKATWLVWAVADIVAFAGQVAQHKPSGLLAGAVLGATTTFFFSLKYGESGWKARDKVCMVISISAIVLWMYFGDSNVGIALSLFALLVAAWPTWVGVWHNPGSEDLKSWIYFNTSSLLGVLAVKHLTMADMAPPAVFMVIDATVLLLILWPRLGRKESGTVITEHW